MDFIQTFSAINVDNSSSNLSYVSPTANKR